MLEIVRENSLSNTDVASNCEVHGLVMAHVPMLHEGYFCPFCAWERDRMRDEMGLTF